MRAALVGFLAGIVVAIAALLIVRPLQIAPITGQVGYHFETCVFGKSDFPAGDIDNGRLLRRALMPVGVSTRFFDAQFQEVKQAEKPGRYGAVVRLDFGDGVHSYRFITLYRTPARVWGDVVAIPITAQIPAEFGLDSAVVRTQQEPIGRAVQDMLIGYENGKSPESVAILLAGLHEMQPADPPTFLHCDAKTRNDAWWYELQTRLGLAPEYHHLVDLPHGYDADPAKHWPLILFLHHADAGGNDISLVRNCALAGLIHRGKEVPAIVVSPQCPAAQSWSMPVLNHLLDTMEAQYRVDPDRVYLTGVSAGGDLTWDLALVHPERFAALVPMSGESDPHDAARLRDIPIWAFQGGNDPNVPPSTTVAMVDAVRQAGGHAHLTLYPDADHDCWDQAYSTEALWTWLFAQKRGQAEVSTPGMPSP
jgi:pimeloyl-ACP methyl ester carboxylesterase